MRLQDLFKDLRSELIHYGVDSPELTIRIFLKDVLNLKDHELISQPDREITPEEHNRLTAFIQRRIKGEPVSKIVGQTEFWGLPFLVNHHVLDPRPETELIVEVALQKFSAEDNIRILDLGTGSGCILIALLDYFYNATGVGVDLSLDALTVASYNAHNNNVNERCFFINGDWSHSIDAQFDLIVSNPPYISKTEIESLPIEVKNHDPILALDGGIDGLEAYRKLLKDLFFLLKPNATALFEIGKNQETDLKRLVEEAGANLSRVHPDLSGILRVVEISCGDK